jgi:predicted TPR repeat methyltransferase
MAETTKGQSLLEGAYRLATPDDNRTFYDRFAATYDSDFAEALGWHYPFAVAAVFRDQATAADRPVADIGCGTGFVAQALRLPAGEIDGIDISQAMLDRAQAKGLYRATIQADLTGPLEGLDRGYGAVVSAGTFTMGHLGPDVLAALLQIARPGGLFVIGVNLRFFAEAGFDPVIRALHDGGRISAPGLVEVPIYDRAGHAHSADKAAILQFRKAG